MVGMNGVATASVAYHESLAYARDAAAGPPARRQGSRRAAGADHRARRRAAHAAAPEGDRRGRRSSLLRRRPRATPTSPSTRRRRRSAQRAPAAARSAHAGRQDFPAEKGFEANALARADPRRLRLLERVPARGVAARSEAQQHPRGHHRHPGPGSARPQGGRRRRRGAAALRRGDRARRSRGRARPAWTTRLVRGAASARIGAVGELTMHLGGAGHGGRRRGDAAPQRRLPGAVLASSSSPGSGCCRPRRRARRSRAGARADATSTRASCAPRSTGSRPSCRACTHLGGAVPLGRGLVRADAAGVVLGRSGRRGARRGTRETVSASGHPHRRLPDPSPRGWPPGGR